MGSFIACWLPFFILYSIGPICPVCHPEIEPRYIGWDDLPTDQLTAQVGIQHLSLTNGKSSY
jgi:hypothetical protein